ncbi:hypothetical protein ACFL3G_02215 [Planctomycetota bacterium]
MLKSVINYHLIEAAIMDSFWAKIVGLGLIVVILIAVVKFLPSNEPAEPEPDQITEQVEPAVKQPRPKPPPRRPRPGRVVKKEPTIEELEGDEFVEDVQAQKIYGQAELHSKLARKPMMTPKKMVDYCRQIIEQYPHTKYAPKARLLLRELPERYRRLYKITDEEMGL